MSDRLKFVSTVLYVDDVAPVVEFYRRAFDAGVRLYDPDVQLPGREPGAAYQFAILDFPGAELAFATHAVGALMMPGYTRPPGGRPSGVEVSFYTTDVPGAFRRAVEAGAEVAAEPKLMPWGQTVAYVRTVEGTFVGLCTPLPA